MPEDCEMCLPLQKWLQLTDSDGTEVQKFLVQIHCAAIVRMDLVVLANHCDGSARVKPDQIFRDGGILPATKAKGSQPFGQGIGFGKIPPPLQEMDLKLGFQLIQFCGLLPNPGF